MTFNPLHTAQDILNTTDLTDPGDIADAVYKATPPGEVRAAYRSLLRDVAREAIRFARMGGPDAEPAVEDEPASEEVVTRVAARSTRLAAIRTQHEAKLRERYYANGEWKMLKDCTLADVLSIAAQRRETAAKNTAMAKYFEELAERMERAGVEFVRDLGDEAA